jgi:isoleucyl-tRNA synthetase
MRADAAGGRRLAAWERADLYGQLRRARAGRPRFVLTTVRPTPTSIHLGTAFNKILRTSSCARAR